MIHVCRVMSTDSTRKYFCMIVGLYDKNNNVLCYRSVPDPCKCLRAPVKKKWEMDWQLVASYFTVKATDIFYSVRSILKCSNF